MEQNTWRKCLVFLLIKYISSSEELQDMFSYFKCKYFHWQVIVLSFVHWVITVELHSDWITSPIFAKQWRLKYKMTIFSYHLLWNVQNTVYGSFHQLMYYFTLEPKPLIVFNKSNFIFLWPSCVHTTEMLGDPCFCVI